MAELRERHAVARHVVSHEAQAQLVETVELHPAFAWQLDIDGGRRAAQAKGQEPQGQRGNMSRKALASHVFLRSYPGSLTANPELGGPLLESGGSGRHRTRVRPRLKFGPVRGQ